MAKSLIHFAKNLGVAALCFGLFAPVAIANKKPVKKAVSKVSAARLAPSSRSSAPKAMVNKAPASTKPGVNKMHLSAAEDASGDFVTEKRSDGTIIKYKKKASYDFEGLGLEGMADKPSGAYISNIKDVKARSMVQIRKDFDAEVSESARQMP